MKIKSIEELEDGMWCRLASGEVYEFSHISPRWRDFGYDQALIDMGAEWYPKIPEGYRLATAEDRRGDPPDNRLYVVPREKDGERFDLAWRPLECDGDVWFPECEYIVPIKQEPKVYTVRAGEYHPIIFLASGDFQPGDRVTVRKVEA